MSTYVSCRCGWRGTSNGWSDHVCFSGGTAQPVHRVEGWPDDLETHRRLGRDARYAITPPPACSVDGKRLAYLEYVRGASSISFVFGNEDSMAWFQGSGVWRQVEMAQLAFMRENPKLCPDVEPGQCQPPAGTATPSLLAACIQARLREQYPGEEIHIWSRTAPTYNTIARRSDT